MGSLFRVVAAQILPCGGPAHRSDDEFRWRIARVFAVSLFAGAYFSVVALNNSADATSPFANFGRGVFLDRGKAAAPISEFMRAKGVVDSLESLQAVCKDQGFYGSDFGEKFECKMTGISLGELHDDANNPILPCTDDRSVQSMIVEGDGESFTELPSVVKQMYKESSTPVEKWLAPYSSGALHSTSNHTASQPVERNHHWDILMRCDPSRVEVSYKVNHRGADNIVIQWWKFKFVFDRIRSDLGLFSGKVSSTVGLTYSTRHTSGVWVPLAAFIAWLLLFAVPCIPSVLLSPRNLFNLWQKNGTCKDLIAMLVDPTGWRISYMPVLKVVIENVACACTFCGFVSSARRIFTLTHESEYHVGPACISDICEAGSLGMSITPFRYWNSVVGLKGLALFSQVAFSMWNATHWHAISLSLLVGRLTEISFILPENAFVMVTLLFAFFPIVHFCAIFGLGILMFAVIIFGFYGSLYPQFSSISRTVWSLLLYTFSFNDVSQAEDGVVPAVEEAALGLQALLLAFQVLVVVMMLNMFTTIFIDAYNIAINRTSSTKRLAELKAAAWYRCKLILGFKHEVEEEVAVMGGVPGRIFFRATVPHEDPLQLKSKTLDMSSMARRMNDAMEILENLRPQFQIMARTDVQEEDDIESGPRDSKETDALLGASRAGMPRMGGGRRTARR